MGNIILMDKVVYNVVTFNNEVQEFEPLVIEHIKDIFGETAKYYSKKTIKTLANNRSIPDGFVIDIMNKKWYILELKLLCDDAINRISRQIVNYKNAVNILRTKKEIYDAINEPSQELYSVIYDTTPEIVIIIDSLEGERGQQFEEQVIGTDSTINIVEFKTYARAFVDPTKIHLHLFNPIIKKDYQTITPPPDVQLIEETRRMRDEVHSPIEKEKTSSYIRTGYTGKKIKSFEFNGKRYEVNGWIFMLLKISEEISRLNRKDLDKLLALKGRKRPYFTKNKNELRSSEKINGTDIFVECNLSANSIVNLCKDVLNLFGYKDNLKIKTL